MIVCLLMCLSGNVIAAAAEHRGSSGLAAFRFLSDDTVE